MNQGYVKIYKKLKDNPIASSIELLGLLAFLLLHAQHKQRIEYRDTEKIVLEAGELIISQKQMAKQFKVSIGKINKMINIFKNEEICETRRHPRFTIVRFINWEIYQGGNEIRMKSDEEDQKGPEILIANVKSEMKSDDALIIQSEIDPPESEEKENEIKNEIRMKPIKNNTIPTTDTVPISNSIISLKGKELGAPEKEEGKRIRRQDAIDMIDSIKKFCEERKLSYSSQDAFKYARLMIMSKDYEKSAKMANLTIQQYSNAIVLASIAIKFWKGPCTGPMMIYLHHSEIYNKFMVMKSESGRASKDHKLF